MLFQLFFSYIQCINSKSYLYDKSADVSKSTSYLSEKDQSKTSQKFAFSSS